jgi:hypothetical protein
VPETRRPYDADFKACAVWLVEETGKQFAQVTREQLGHRIALGLAGG